MRVAGVLALVAAIAGALASCDTPDHYAWGGYQDSLEASFLTPDADLQAEIHALADQLEQTQSTGKRVPPGLRAHLAMLNAKAGDRAAARALLQQEAIAFPESAVFVQTLLTGLER